MSGEMMEAEDTVVVCKIDSSEDTMEVNAEESSSSIEGKDVTDGNHLSAWPLKHDTENEVIEALSSDSLPSEGNKTKHSPESLDANESQKRDKTAKAKNVWSIRSPFPIKHSCPYNPVERRKSHETYTSKQDDEHLSTAKGKGPNAVKSSFDFNSSSSSSAFVRKVENRPQPFIEDDLEGNILKRCNSAPILNDADDCSVDWSRPIASSTGRIRRFSANVVSVNSSPSSTAKTRLRLHQLKKEESLEEIQNKETAHEREVQTTIQISSNCGDLSLSDRRNSLDSCLSSPRNSASPCSFPPLKNFPTPPSALTGVKSNHSRAIDFSGPVYIGGTFSPTSQPHLPSPYMPPSGGIPSPLTFSPCLLNLSPLPPSPTRGICGPGKQCFSPSMQVPVSLARAASRSPSPSPTRRTFVTRRRSQSPCIMRPSALGPIKRKYDSDSEGSCSPKRIFLSNPSHIALSGGSSDASTAMPHSTPARTLVQRSHSLSSSSVDSSDLYVSPSPPHQGPTFVTHHHGNNTVTGLLHPLHHSSSPMHPHGVAPPQITLEQPNRSSSPASSTSSSSSLEALRDLQPLTSAHQAITQKKS